MDASAEISLGSLIVTPVTATIQKGSQQSFIATGVFTDDTKRDLTALVLWTAADASGVGVAAIDAAGLATGNAPGSSVIMASYQGKTSSVTLQVTPTPVVALTISPLRPTVAQATSQQFIAIATLADNSTQDVSTLASWAAADLNGSSVAVINAAGLATGNGSGQAAITVTYLGKSAATTMQVNNVTLSSVALTPSNSVVAKNLSVQFRAIGTFSDSSQQDLTAQSTLTAADMTGSGVASITKSGLCSAKSAGTALITATILGKSAATMLTVIDATLSSLAVMPQNISINKNAVQQFTFTATYSDSSTQDVTQSAIWKTTDVTGTSVASISDTGLCTGTSGGSAAVSAGYGGKSASTELKVIGSTLPAPMLNVLTPARGPTTGGIALTLQGNNFVAGDTVRIATASALSVIIDSATQITATLPALAGAFGLVPVVVTHADGQSVTRSDLFAYFSSTLGFGTATSFAAGTAPSSMVSGDFNQDGKLDLAVANAGSNTVSVLLGTGTGTFGAATNYPVGTSPSSLATGDFNGDAKPDLLVANKGSLTASLLLNQGNGTFVNSASLLTEYPISFIAVGDVNGDGKLDYVIVAKESNYLKVMINDGAGGFRSSTITAGINPSYVVVQDLNNDNNLDLAIGHTGSNDVHVRLGAGDGSFAASLLVTATSPPTALATGDFNADGKLDLVLVNPASNNIDVRLGVGNGTFGAATNISGSMTPSFVVVRDINGDGKPDLALVTASNQVSVRLGSGTGTFGTATSVAVSTTPAALVVGDFNGDLKPDLISANSAGNNISVVLNSSQ